MDIYVAKHACGESWASLAASHDTSVPTVRAAAVRGKDELVHQVMVHGAAYMAGRYRLNLAQIAELVK